MSPAPAWRSFSWTNEDYLRVRDHPKWAKNSKEALYVRKLGRTPDESYETYRQFMDTRPPQVLANIALCLIHQANYLLDQQRRRLEKDFVKKGGIKERMTAARLAYRKRQPSQPPKPHPGNQPPPNRPKP